MKIALMVSRICGTALIGMLLLSIASAQPVANPFCPNCAYNPAIPSPQSVLGFQPGDQTTHYDDALRYIKAVAAASDRVKLFEIGETVEKRKQIFVAISNPENIKRLDEIRGNVAKLGDPRVTNKSTAESILETTPAIVWIGYGIHGDEVSSVDAALYIIYQLAAGTDEAIEKILRELVICIDPMENPDGRERFLLQMQQWAGVVANSDAQSIQHVGVWPAGRGSHYFFDLNRDWIMLTHPETRNRVRALQAWTPQVMIDSHEMGSDDTYLFSPANDPYNPNVSDNSRRWSDVFAADQAKAFDRYGWSYYTREWSDEWYPGYGSSYAYYIDAVGILYEQAGVDGSSVKRSDGTTLTYLETVHHHYVSSLANLGTAAEHRKELLKDFYQMRAKGVATAKGDIKTLYLLPGANQTRLDRLVETLLLQSIEVSVLSKDTKVSGLSDYWGGKNLTKTLPAGTYILSYQQPLGRLAKSILEFDPRMTTKFLQEERKEIEKNKSTRIYDITAWSLPMAYGVETYGSSDEVKAQTTLVKEIAPATGEVKNQTPLYGYMFACDDDHAMEALNDLLGRGCVVRIGKEPVVVEGLSFQRGAALLRIHENPATLSQTLQQIAKEYGITITGVSTAKTTTGPDLGGNDFVCLKQPRIGIVGGSEVSATSFGFIWQLLDYRMKTRVSVVQAFQLGYADLGKYNVIILPSAGNESLQRGLGRAGIAKLRDWVEKGGTLIGTGSASAFLADTANDFSRARLRQVALKDLETYTKYTDLEGKAGTTTIDSVAFWEGKPLSKDQKTETEKEKKSSDKEIAFQEEQGRQFMPRGAILRVDLDPEYWLTFYAGDKVPAIVYTSNAFLSKDPVRTPGRFSSGDQLRLSGLLWPEARDRWAKTAFLTREQRGNGQIILFVNEPVFRGFFRSTERLFLNSVLLGPGFGTTPKAEW
jgi:hypothetical protein